jgi:PEP-CTERM motif
MKSRTVLGMAMATVAVGAFSSHALAALNPLDHTQWVEDYYYNGFGGAAPPGLVESSVGFSTIGDYDGRVLSNAAVTTNMVDGSALDSINTELFAIQDANLYEFKITDPSTFSASNASGGLVMALFASDGTALSAAVGASALNSSNDGVTAAGTYYIGLATASDYPENNEGENIFGLTGATGVFSPVVSDKVLSTDQYIAWTNPGDADPGDLLANTSFLAGGDVITLTGSAYAVVPEPTSIMLLMVGGTGLMLRRRKSRAAR